MNDTDLSEKSIFQSHLRGTIKRAEKELEDLGFDKNKWREAEIVFNGWRAGPLPFDMLNILRDYPDKVLKVYEEDIVLKPGTFADKAIRAERFATLASLANRLLVASKAEEVFSLATSYAHTRVFLNIESEITNHFYVKRASKNRNRSTFSLMEEAVIQQVPRIEGEAISQYVLRLIRHLKSDKNCIDLELKYGIEPSLEVTIKKENEGNYVITYKPQGKVEFRDLKFSTFEKNIRKQLKSDS
tara:strand:- start:4253 stop:4981 length:729 start_codon:yes stop_codon:yes gene_type:complete